MEKNLKYLGIACIAIGSITAISCFFSLFIALPLGFLGMIISAIYVYIDTKNEINTSGITAGIIGLLLSSAPVLLILFLIVYHYFKHTH
jgi:hypothetical protein